MRKERVGSVCKSCSTHSSHQDDHIFALPNATRSWFRPNRRQSEAPVRPDLAVGINRNGRLSESTVSTWDLGPGSLSSHPAVPSQAKRPGFPSMDPRALQKHNTKCYLESNLNRAGLLAPRGKPYRTRRGNQKTVRISTLATQIYPKRRCKRSAQTRDSTSGVHPRRLALLGRAALAALAVAHLHHVGGGTPKQAAERDRAVSSSGPPRWEGGAGTPTGFIADPSPLRTFHWRRNPLCKTFQAVGSPQPEHALEDSGVNIRAGGATRSPLARHADWFHRSRARKC